MTWSGRHGDWHTRLSNMPDPVHLLVFTRGNTLPEVEARRFGEELQAISRNVRLELYDVDEKPLLAARYGITRTPAFALLLGGVTIEDARIRYYGLPVGPLRQAFITAIVTVGNSRAYLAPFDGYPVEQLGRPVHLQVLVRGGSVVDLRTLLRIQRLASSNPRVRADIVSVEEFPELAAKYRMQAVMAIIVDDSITFADSPTGRRWLEAIDVAAAAAGADVRALHPCRPDVKDAWR